MVNGLARFPEIIFIPVLHEVSQPDPAGTVCYARYHLSRAKPVDMSSVLSAVLLLVW